MRMLKTVSLVLITLFSLQAVAFAGDKPIDAIKEKVKKMVETRKKEAPSISVQEFKNLMDKQESFFEILDIRTTEEFLAGHIAGAVNSDRNKLEWMTPNKIDDPAVPIYVYCKAGSRGALATLRLIEMGYANVTNVDGGLKAWANAGYPMYNDLGEFAFTEKGFGKKPE